MCECHNDAMLNFKLSILSPSDELSDFLVQSVKAALPTMPQVNEKIQLKYHQLESRELCRIISNQMRLLWE